MSGPTESASCTALLQSNHGTTTMRHRAMDGDLCDLPERIACSQELQMRLAHEIDACTEVMLRTRIATRMSVTCNPGPTALIQLQAAVDAELARRAIESVCLEFSTADGACKP